MDKILMQLNKFYKNHLETFKVLWKGRTTMCKCKKVFDTATAVGNSKSRSNVAVSINVTDIVKYVAIAGVAIVGIIFGTKTWCNYMKNKEDEEE